MKMKNIIFLICLVSLIGCDMETDTTNPQFSRNIDQSKKDDHFLFEVNCVNYGDSLFRFDKIWIERCWKNEVHLGKRKIKRTEGLQMVIQISKYRNSFFSPTSYSADWTMKNIATDD